MRLRLGIRLERKRREPFSAGTKAYRPWSLEENRPAAWRPVIESYVLRDDIRSVEGVSNAGSVLAVAYGAEEKILVTARLRARLRNGVLQQKDIPDRDREGFSTRLTRLDSVTVLFVLADLFEHRCGLRKLGLEVAAENVEDFDEGRVAEGIEYLVTFFAADYDLLAAQDRKVL